MYKTAANVKMHRSLTVKLVMQQRGHLLQNACLV